MVPREQAHTVTMGNGHGRQIGCGRRVPDQCVEWQWITTKMDKIRIAVAVRIVHLTDLGDYSPYNKSPVT